MDILNNRYQTLRVRLDEDICFVQIYRPGSNNAINDCLIAELSRLLSQCAGAVKILVLEGLPTVFCSGADFNEIQATTEQSGDSQGQTPGPLYDLWHQLTSCDFITVAHVKGRVNAGGVGFVAACDIVLSENRATFGLSELLFGLMPACVFPFLLRRIGFARANYLTLSTQPIAAPMAQAWGLVDASEDDSDNLLRKHLLRLRRLDIEGIARYKRYASSLNNSLTLARESALAANMEVFSHPDNLRNITRYVKSGKFPWEAD